MPCFTPLRVWMGPGKDGKQSISFLPKPGLTPGNELACGRCIGCRVRKAQEWTARLVHEASLHLHSQFLTLTYADAELPPGESLCLRDVQLFMKRLRKKYGEGLRFYLCGEYGDQTWRPHYHALIFGLRLDDLEPYKKTRRGEQLYTSSSLTKLWGLGHVVIGAVTPKTAAYCAHYVCKKIVGPPDDINYENRKRPFAVMSRRPGIGAYWVDRFASDLYPDDFVVLDGKQRGKPPAYYDRRIAVTRPELIASMKEKRKQYALQPKVQANSSTSRRKVRAEVLEARVSLTKRNVNGA